MTMPIRAYPLTWPEGWKRTPAHGRKPDKFGRARRQDYRTGAYVAPRDLSINEATLRVREELERLGVRDDDVVVSTNLVLRLDGQPRSDQRAPEDPGVAVYWETKTGQRCIAIDQYTKVTGNLAAIAATLEAMRAIERHGGAEILDRAFTGFTALPGPSTADWWDVLEVRRDASRDVIHANYRRLRSQHHPDRGGDSDAFQRVQRAFDQAQREGLA
jgi:hypothetical protein